MVVPIECLTRHGDLPFVTYMRTLTNLYQDFDLINLGYHSSGRGPYVIRQDGIPPGSETVEEDRFFLRNDGVWVINFSVGTLPEEVQNAFLLDEIADVQKLIESLSGKPIVQSEIPSGMTKDEILQAMEGTQSRIWQRIREAKASRLSLEI